jgi:hypothetical protein
MAIQARVELPETGRSGVPENLYLQEYRGIGFFSFESITSSFHLFGLYLSGLLRS